MLCLPYAGFLDCHEHIANKLDFDFNERPKKTARNGTEPQNHTQTHGHGNSMTESAQWGRFSEKNPAHGRH